jgi:hypothetical protein
MPYGPRDIVRLILSLLVTLGLAASLVESARPDMCLATSAAGTPMASSELSPPSTPTPAHLHTLCHCSFAAGIGLPVDVSLSPILSDGAPPLAPLATLPADVLTRPLVPPPIA